MNEENEQYSKKNNRPNGFEKWREKLSGIAVTLVMAALMGWVGWLFSNVSTNNAEILVLRQQVLDQKARLAEVEAEVTAEVREKTRDRYTRKESDREHEEMKRTMDKQNADIWKVLDKQEARVDQHLELHFERLR